MIIRYIYDDEEIKNCDDYARILNLLLTHIDIDITSIYVRAWGVNKSIEK